MEYLLGQAADLSWFDRGVAIGVIAFGCLGMTWLVRRYFGKDGIADQRTAAMAGLADSIRSLTITCHECRDEQKEYMRDLQSGMARYADLLEGK